MRKYGKVRQAEISARAKRARAGDREREELGKSDRLIDDESLLWLEGIYGANG